jgi:uncharacterized protein YdeI (YjbR/CyaY-like superfamily)
MAAGDREHVRFHSRAELRAWLAANAETSPAIFAVIPRPSSSAPGPTYEELVEECLCFGWIDATTRRHDEDTNAQMIAPRRPGSTWTGVNKARIERLTAEGLMAPRGLRVVAAAQANGSWTSLDAVERGEVPEDLVAALDQAPGAREFFDAMPPGVRRQHVWHVVSAKRPDTRARRIADIVAAAGAGRRALG